MQLAQKKDISIILWQYNSLLIYIYVFFIKFVAMINTLIVKM